MITYAASFGNTTLKKLIKYGKADEIGLLLKKFYAISVRDSNSGSIVKQLTGDEPVYNLDPVLIYDYINCCDKIPTFNLNEKYLILYAYAGRISNGEADWIAEYAKKKNLKIYAIGGIQKCADRFIEMCDKSIKVDRNGCASEKDLCFIDKKGLPHSAGYLNKYDC